MTWPTLADELIVANVAGRRIIADPSTGRIVAVDRIGEFVLDHAAQFADHDDAVEALADLFALDRATIAHDLTRLTDQLPPRQEVTTKKAAVVQRVPPQPPPHAAHQWPIDALGVGILVECSTPALTALIEPLLRAHRPATSIDHHIALWDGELGITVVLDGVSHGTSDDVALALSRMVSAITATASSAGPAPRIHAGCVEFDGRAVALVGASNQGKSSTVLELLRRGGAYLTDEVITIEPDSRWVRGLPRPIGLDGPIRHIHRELEPVWSSIADFERWLVPGDFQMPASTGAPLSGLFFMDFAMDASPGLTPMEPLSAVAELFSATFDRNVRPTDLVDYGRIVEATPCYRLVHHGAPDAATRIIEWLGQ
ncbi:MAG TPA: hypothetical protein PKV27_04355 [Ilumatobacteraceae bacterium]|nr:hypothetical protein [Ilumatobacteraceae bacterium]